MQFQTKLIRAGVAPEANYGAVMTPIHLTATFAQEAVAVTQGYDYSRSGNPTRDSLKTHLAALEGARFCEVHTTGMSSITTLLHLLRAGDHVICSQDCYGGTFRVLTEVFAHSGIEATFLDLQDEAALRAALRPETRLIWVETPTNPLLRLVDIRKIAAISKEAGSLLVVDNTFCSPLLQRPIELGADLVIHSTTKYLNGHCDVLGGAIITDSEPIAERIATLTNAMGVGASPFDCWLILRGTKTLKVRLEEQQRSAQRIADALEADPRVARVFYPGLKSHADHALACRQQDGFGAMLSLELAGGLAGAKRFAESTELFTLGESLGGVQSLIELPALQSHASMTPAARLQAGIADSLVRLSVGLEGADDLLADLKQALDNAIPAAPFAATGG